MVNWLIISFLLSIVSYILVDQVSSMTSYCNVDSCPYNTHTICKYRFPRYSSWCGDRRYIKSGLTRNEVFELVRAHNYLRAFVASGREKRGRPGPQPRAKNLGPLVWNNELAMVAQRWANQCVFGHDQCRNLAQFKVGQNVAFSSTSTVFPNNLTSIVLQWYDEVADFNRHLVNKLQFTTAHVLHYTQMVWAETKQVGCGCIRYKKNNYWYTTQLVCNYGPTGNVIGQPIYKINE